MPRTLYQKIREIWKDKPDKSTPLLAEDLMHIEQGIYDNSANMALKEIYNDQYIDLSSIKHGQDAGGFSVMFGLNAKASGIGAMAQGTGVVAKGIEQFAHGRYNVEDTAGKYAEIVGGGSSGAPKNIHTLDWNGNAEFAGDVSTPKYSLNQIGEKLDTADTATETDITAQCSVSANGQKLAVTIPISGTVVSLQGTECIAGGSFLGKIILGSIPPLLFNADISVVKYQNNSFDVSGIAHLTNTYKSTNPQYGTVLKGSIEVGSLSQTSVNECSGTAKLTFEFDSELTVNTFIIYKSLRYYYPIAQLWSDMTEKIKTLEQRVEVLEQQAGHI